MNILTEPLQSTELNNYKMINLFKYAAALMVICIHCEPVLSSEYLSFIIRNIICRIAVPFFFISSAYFVRRGCDRKTDYLKSYLRKLTSSYLFWSAIFIPIGLDWIHQNFRAPNELLPFALLFALIDIGTYYHLWYIPALIFSLYAVDKLLKHISYRSAFYLSIPLFIFGSFETYYGILPAGTVKNFFDMIINISFTTRNGLLFGFIFTVIGFYIYDYSEKLKFLVKALPALTFICGVSLILEGTFLFNIERLDENFLLTLIPFSFFLFLSLLASKRVFQIDTTHLGKLSKYYYFTHPICILIVEETANLLQLNLLSSTILSLAAIIFLTHILCESLIKISDASIKYSYILPSIAVSTVITILAGFLIFILKSNSDVYYKFELIPSIWIFSGLSIYSIISIRKSLKQSIS